MKLNANERKNQTKSDVNQLRRSGKIPAVLYSPGKEGVLLAVDTAEFKTALRGIKQGHLPTTVFTLNSGGKERKAVIKDIQRHPTTYDVIHLDFQELIKDMPVCVKVPILCIGVADCAGIKLGGFLRQVIRYVKVECLPHTIPAEFVIDVKDLGIRQTKRLRDLVMPAGVKALAPMDEVVVVIAKR
jgi:large subunit ribosomal protein L25